MKVSVIVTVFTDVGGCVYSTWLFAALSNYFKNCIFPTLISSGWAVHTLAALVLACGKDMYLVNQPLSEVYSF